MDASRRPIRNVIGNDPRPRSRSLDRAGHASRRVELWRHGSRAPASRRRSRWRAAWRRSRDRDGRPSARSSFAFWDAEEFGLDRLDRVRRGDAGRAAREGRRLHQHRPVDARPLRWRRHAVAARLPRAGDARRAALRRQGLGLRRVARRRMAAPAGRAAPARRRTASRWSWLRSAAAPTSSRSRIFSACRRCRWSSTSRAATARITRTTTRGSTSSGTSIRDSRSARRWPACSG